MRSLGVHSVYVLDDHDDPFASAARDDRGRQRAGRGDPRRRPTKASPPRAGAAYEKLDRNDLRQRCRRRLHGRRRQRHDARACGGNCTAPTRSLKLLADSAMSTPPFASHLGAGRRRHLPDHARCSRAAPTRPRPSACWTPTAARSARRADPWALYGYATMRMVLDAIDSAGHDATDRRDRDRAAAREPRRRNRCSGRSRSARTAKARSPATASTRSATAGRRSCARSRCRRTPKPPRVDRSAAGAG